MIDGQLAGQAKGDMCVRPLMAATRQPSLLSRQCGKIKLHAP